MNCFECRSDLTARKSFKVGNDSFCWPCVFKILGDHISDVWTRESDIDQKALADELGFYKFITEND